MWNEDEEFIKKEVEKIEKENVVPISEVTVKKERSEQKSVSVVEEMKRPEIVKMIPESNDKNVFYLMDSEDEKEIVKAELFDETIKSLVYRYSGGQLTLTINGVFEAARRFKNIRTGVTKIEKTKDSYIAYAYAENLKDNIKVELAVEQPIKVYQQGTLVLDSFALIKAQSKAIRNCVRKVIPANFFQAMIKRYVEKMKENKPNIGGK